MLLKYSNLACKLSGSESNTIYSPRNDKAAPWLEQSNTSNKNISQLCHGRIKEWQWNRNKMMIAKMISINKAYFSHLPAYISAIHSEDLCRLVM